MPASKRRNSPHGAWAFLGLLFTVLAATPGMMETVLDAAVEAPL